MCRSIKTLFHSGHKVDSEEIQNASLQFVRKLSGFRKPSKINEAAFNKAIKDIAVHAHIMLSSLKTNTHKHTR